MEMMTSATTQTPVVFEAREHLAIRVLRRTGQVLVDAFKSTGTAMADPWTCTAFWIGSSPAVWLAKR
jgi:hypothetical protein